MTNRVGRAVAPLVVAPEEIWRTPSPAGGGFAALARPPLPASVLARLGLATFCVDTREPVVSLTYDDGPNPEHTPRILDALAARKATATFFVLGEQVRSHPAIARRIVADGHELALHGMDHVAMTTRPDRQAVRSVRNARELVEDATGARVRLFRPPYGKYTRRQAIGVRRLGLELVLWSGHALDWIDAEPEAVAGRALKETFPGAILLLHDHRADPQTLEEGQELPTFDKVRVLELILEGLRSRRVTTLTTTDLITTQRKVRSAIRSRMVRE